MRLILTAVLLLFFNNAYSYPVLEAGFVHDPSGLLNPADTDAISAAISSCEEKCGVKFRLFIIGSVSDYPGAPRDFDEFCAGLFPQVYAGGYSEKAAVMVVAIKDRMAKIELGSPLESRYSAGTEKIVRKKMVPYFKNNDYSRGIFTGFSSFKALFTGPVKKGVNPVFVILSAVLFAVGGAAVYVFKVKKIKIKLPAGSPKKSVEVFGGGAWGKWQ